MKLLALIAAHLVLVAPLTIALATLSRLDHPVADLLVQFAAPAFVATLGLTLVLALLRLMPAAGSGLVVVVLLLVANWPQWFVATSPAPSTVTPVITIYSANLWVKNQDRAAMARSIEAAQPDILVLIEMRQTARQLAKDLASTYPHQVVAGRSPDHPQSAILSRYPLREVDADRHPETAAAVADTPLGPVNIVAAHLTRPWPFQPPDAQAHQIERLARLRAGLKGPVILAGDFNAVSHGQMGRKIANDLGLTPAPAWPGTFPVSLPAPLGMTIDHVWLSPELHLVSRRLGQPSGSDHRPVVVRFTKAD